MIARRGVSSRRRGRVCLAAALIVFLCGSMARGGTPPAAPAPGTSRPTGDIQRLIDEGEYEEAETAARALLRKMEAYSEAGSPDRAEPLEIARVLDLLVEGMRRGGKGADPEARAHAERAVRIKEERLDPWHPDLATSLNNLGTLLYTVGDYEQARRHYERALAIREKAFGEFHLDVARSVNNLAVLEDEDGDSETAGPLYERALKIREKVLPPDHPDLAKGLVNLAAFLTDHGAYLRARPMLERALAIQEQKLGLHHPLLITTLNNLANLLYAIGDHAEAEPLYARALKIAEKSSGAAHPDVAMCLNNLANLQMDLGRTDEAEPLLERALKIREESLGDTHPDVAMSLFNLAGLHADTGDLAGARSRHERALAVAEKAGAAGSAVIAEALHALAYLDWRAGEHASAGRRYERSVAILEMARGREHPSVARMLANRASFLAMTGDTAGALDASLEAEAIGRRHVRLTSQALAERQALRYAALRASGLDVAISIAVRRRDPATAGRVWDALIRSRALVLDEMLARGRIASAKQDPVLSRLTRELAKARQRLSSLIVRGPEEEPVGVFHSRLAEARRRNDEAERALAERSLEFRREKEMDRAGLSEIVSALGPGDAIVAFVRYRDLRLEASGSTESNPIDAFAAFVLRGASGQPALIRLADADEIHRLVAAWSEEASNGVVRSGHLPEAIEASYRAAGEALKKKIWAPMAPALRGAKRLFVVPDGALHLVNLAALPAGETAFLVETGPLFHYLSAERDLLAAARRERARAAPTAGRGLLVVGGPDFDSTAPFSAPAAERTTTELHRPPASVSPLCDGLRSARFDALPGTEQEASEIAALWQTGRHAATQPTTRAPGSDPHETRAASEAGVLVLLGAGATETAFKKSLPGTRVLHLATHGFFLDNACAAPLAASTPPREHQGAQEGGTAVASRGIGGLKTGERIESRPTPPEMLVPLAGLALAGANHRSAAGPGEDDGILTAEEIAAMDLTGVEWAVLSACDTGAGQIHAGEGVFGLRRAFQVAGVGTVIMSLWSVGDEAARVWMKSLYEARLTRRMDTARAVRQASLDTLRERRARGESTHPFYWAAFVAAGSWR